MGSFGVIFEKLMSSYVGLSVTKGGIRFGLRSLEVGERDWVLDGSPFGGGGFPREGKMIAGELALLYILAV